MGCQGLVESLSLEGFKEDWINQCHGLVDKVVICHRLDSMISEISSTPTDSVFL